MLRIDSDGAGLLTFDDIEAAREAIRSHIYQTPCAHSRTLSDQCGARVYLKLENLQMTGSFKERGALYRLLRASAAEKASGVVAASAGNHAQGVSYHATRAGISATIVMPTYTPLVKVTATRRHGGQVVLHGDSYDAAYAEAQRIAADEGRVLIHAFDDVDVIAGQGTVGLELLEQNPYLDAIVVPIGGGGLIAGIATAVKQTNPRIAVYGVEPAAMPAMRDSIRAGHVVDIPTQRTLADGLAVRRVGQRPFELVQQYVDDIVTVDDEELASAVLTLLEVEKTVTEGAGAAALAALLHRRLPLAGKKVALVVSGGNIDVTMLSRIIRRGLVKDGRMARFHVGLRDTPGSLSELTGVIAGAGGNIMEIRHNREFTRRPLGETEVTLTIEGRGHEHIKDIVTAAAAVGITLAAE